MVERTSPSILINMHLSNTYVEAAQRAALQPPPGKIEMRCRAKRRAKMAMISCAEGGRLQALVGRAVGLALFVRWSKLISE